MSRIRLLYTNHELSAELHMYNNNLVVCTFTDTSNNINTYMGEWTDNDNDTGYTITLNWGGVNKPLGNLDFIPQPEQWTLDKNKNTFQGSWFTFNHRHY